MGKFIDIDKRVTDLTDIEVDITCNPYMWCGQSIKNPIRKFHSDTGFSLLQIKGLVIEAREEEGVECNHQFFEGLEEISEGKYKVELGS